MKISKLIELLHPYQDFEACVIGYDPSVGEETVNPILGIRIDIDEEGEAERLLIRV